MVAATTDRRDGRDTWQTKQHPNQLRMGGVTGVVVTLGNILRRRSASTPCYRPTIPFRDIQEGMDVARACAMAGVVLQIGRTWSGWNVGNCRKNRVWRERLFQAKKGNRKTPAESQC